MRDQFDVVIVGGGIIGAACAYFLAAEDGSLRIAVVEPDPTYARASTPKATGVIRQQFAIPENIRMCVFGSAFLRQAPEALAVQGERADIGFKEQGYIWLVDPHLIAEVKAMQAVQAENGADVTFLDPEALSRKLPQYDASPFGGGFFGSSGAGWFDPWALLQAFRRKAVSLGVEFVRDAVVALETSGRRVASVATAGGRTMSAGSVVNCAGALGAARVGAMAGVAIPVEPRKRCVFHIESAVDARGFPMTVHLRTGVWFRPEGSGVLCGVAPRPENDLATEDDTVDHTLFEETIWPALAEVVPGFEAVKVRNTHACFYDFNPLDENAILGRVEPYDNFYAATGYSGHGVMQAPASGRAIAELIVHGRYRTLDLTRFGYGRILAGAPLPEPACF